MTVTAGPAIQIAVSPTSSTIDTNGQQPYTVTGKDQYGNSTGDVTRRDELLDRPCRRLLLGQHVLRLEPGRVHGHGDLPGPDRHIPADRDGPAAPDLPDEPGPATR